MNFEILLKKLIYKFIFTFVAFLLVMISGAFLIEYQIKFRTAQMLSGTLRENMINNSYRASVIALNTVIDQFSNIEFRNNLSELQFNLPENSKEKKYLFLMPINVEIYSDQNKKNVFGVFNFYYNPFLNLIYVLIFWIFFVTAAIPFFLKSKKQLQITYLDSLERQKKENYMLIAEQVSHDIKSPLSALNISIGYLAEMPIEHKKIINSSINRINEISQSLLNYSKNQKNVIASEMAESIDYEIFVRSIEELINEKKIESCINKNIKFKVDFSEVINAKINIDLIEIKRVLSNILNNSMEALTAQAEPEIQINTSFYSNLLVLTIIDNGCGIAEEHLQNIGLKGFTYGKESSNSGTGLGLHHAKQTIEAAKGKLEIHSRLGEGTMVSIKLPIF